MGRPLTAVNNCTVYSSSFIQCSMIKSTVKDCELLRSQITVNFAGKLQIYFATKGYNF